MKNNNLNIYYLIIFAFLFFISPQIAGGETITMTEYLSQVRASHPLFKKTAIQSAIAKAERKSLGGKNDLTLSATPYYLTAKPIDNVSLLQVKKAHGAGLTIEAKKNIWLTGTQLSLSWDGNKKYYHLWDKINTTNYNFNEYTSKFTLGIIQPLLQNFRSKLDRIEYDLKKYDIAIADLQSKEVEEDFILHASIKYLDWVLLQEELSIAGKRLLLAKKMHSRNRKMHNLNLLKRVDLMRSLNELQSAEALIINARAALIAKKSELTILSDNKAIFNKKPDFNIYDENIFKFPDNSVGKIENRSRILRYLSQEMNKLHCAQRASKNALLPDLSLILTGTLYSNKSHVKSIIDTTHPELYVGLRFSIPIGNNEALGQDKKLSLQIKELEYSILETENKIEAEAIRLKVMIQEIKKILTINRKQIKAAKAKTTEEIRQLNRGNGNYFYVIESRDKEYIARINYANSAYNYHVLILNYKALTDSLLNK